MNRSLRKFLGLMLMPLLMVGCGTADAPAVSAPSPAPQPVSEVSGRGAAHVQCLYYERELVLGGLSAPRPYAPSGRPRAGMVPHHLLASDMIAGFFSLAAEYADSYDTVILVSPSHFPESCGSDIVTAKAGWSTPFGGVDADIDVVDVLLGNPLIAAENNPAAVEKDHGVAGLVPFVRHYLPSAKVCAVLLSNRLSRDRLAAVQQELAALCEGGRMLMVASVDCSHYLIPEEAALRDAETAAAIESFQLQRILGFTDSNVDSPQALTTFLSVAQAQALTLTRLDHSSSAEKLPYALSNPIYADGITTYFVYAAWDKADGNKRL